MMEKKQREWRQIKVDKALFDELQRVASQKGFANASELARFYLRLVVRGDID